MSASASSNPSAAGTGNAASAPAPAAGGAACLTGVLERIIFFNEENHYVIGELRVEHCGRDGPPPPPDLGATVTILGSLPGVQCGETLELTGAWARHRERGLQFKVASFVSKLPSSVHGIRKYLGSGLVRGIGKTYAEKIVARFGEDTLKVISTQSGRLREVPGIGEQRARSIKKAWDEQSALREVMVFLQTYGVTTGQCLRIVKKYGALAPINLEADPYLVAREIDGIGFRTADRIARNLGLSTEGEKRVRAGVLFALGERAEEGDTAVAQERLLELAGGILELPAEKIAPSLDALAQEGAVCVAGCDDEKAPVNAALAAGALIQLPDLWKAERRIARAVARILRGTSSLPPILVDNAVAWAQDKAGFAFAPAQAQGVRSALTSKFSILTGGPGTGKTTILSALCRILRAKKVRIALAAPTGRAAQRMAETTGLAASTLHRLLRWEPDKGAFSHNGKNPLAADFVVVDEASMLDTQLAASLFAAVPPEAHLLLVGDVHQLPSVGAGNVLKDLIASRLAAVTTLTAIFRQGARSEIVGTAHDILQGVVAPPALLPDASALDPVRELQFVSAATPEACVEQIKTLAAGVLSRRCALDPLRDVQVLVPMHKGIAGVQAINTALQNALNPNARAGTAAGGGWRIPLVGDKVIQSRNNYEKGVFNGDMGRVTAVTGTGNDLVLTAEFDGVTADYDTSDVSELQLAYAITIHKSQGSEFNTVIIPVLKTHYIMLRRNLIYTALTRGRKRVILVGDPAAYGIAVRNNENSLRSTALPARLEAVER